MENYTRIYKDHYKNWQVKTQVSLNDIVHPRMVDGKQETPVLKVHTSKNSNGLLTTFASVSWQSGAWETSTIFQDFGQTIARHDNVKRVTEKSISEAHNLALIKLPELLEAVKAYYKEQKTA